MFTALLSVALEMYVHAYAVSPACPCREVFGVTPKVRHKKTGNSLSDFVNEHRAMRDYMTS
jgi:hypothetical protein